MIKYMEKTKKKETAMNHLLAKEEANGYKPHRIFVDDDDDEIETTTDRRLNGKNMMSLSSIEPKSKKGDVGFSIGSSLIPARRAQKRVVFKNGDCNVVQENVAKRRRRFLSDIFTTLVDIEWTYNILIFSLSFLLSWFIFAIFWWLIGYLRGDYDHLDDPKWVPCVRNMPSFMWAIVFSIESQTTIGFGYMYITDQCVEAIALVSVQSIAGTIIQAFMVGIVFAKLSRPKKRTETLLFSRNAVVSLRDGKLCLMFRVADMRKSLIIEAQVHAQLIKRRMTIEGEILNHHLHEVKVSFDTCDDNLFFIWPCTLVHVIDDTSPFYAMSAHEMQRENFEIVVFLEGSIESTGMATQARSSYLPTEILWGYRFEQLVKYRDEAGEYKVDYSRFNNVYEVDTPLCSAHDLQKSSSLQRKRTIIRSRSKKEPGGRPLEVPNTLAPVPDAETSGNTHEEVPQKQHIVGQISEEEDEDII